MFKQNPDVDMDVMRFRLGGGTRYFDSGFFDFASTVVTAGYVRLVVPFFCPVTTKFDRIAVYVTVAEADKVARLGIYEDNGKIYPGKLLLDAGEISVGTTGAKEIVIDKTLRGGKLYWLAHHTNSISVEYRALAVGSHLATLFGLSSTLGTDWGFYYGSQPAYAPLPDPYAPTNLVPATGTPIRISLRKA